MKKIIFIAVFVVVLFVGGYLFRMYINKDKLKFGLAGFNFDPEKRSGLLFKIMADQGIKSEFTINVKNFSGVAYSIKRLMIDLYTESGQLIAEQTSPVTSFNILPDSVENLLKLDYFISIPGIIALYNAATAGKGEGTLAITKAIDFFKTGKLGAKLVMKGTFEVFGFTVPINEVVAI